MPAKKIQSEELMSGQSPLLAKALAVFGKISRGRRFGLIKVRDYHYADGELFLRRYVLIQNRFFAIYIHRLTAMNSGYPHTHAWNFWTWVLRGGYTESVSNLDGRKYERQHTWGSFKRTKRDEAHKISSLNPSTLTLVLAGRLHQDWGFMTEAGYVHWEQQGGVDESEGEEFKRV